MLPKNVTGATVIQLCVITKYIFTIWFISHHITLNITGSTIVFLIDGVKKRTYNLIEKYKKKQIPKNRHLAIENINKTRQAVETVNILTLFQSHHQTE